MLPAKRSKSTKYPSGSRRRRSERTPKARDFFYSEALIGRGVLELTTDDIRGLHQPGENLPSQEERRAKFCEAQGNTLFHEHLKPLGWNWKSCMRLGSSWILVAPLVTGSGSTRTSQNKVLRPVHRITAFDSYQELYEQYEQDGRTMEHIIARGKHNGTTSAAISTRRQTGGGSTVAAPAAAIKREENAPNNNGAAAAASATTRPVHPPIIKQEAPSEEERSDSMSPDNDHSPDAQQQQRIEEMAEWITNTVIGHNPLPYTIECYAQKLFQEGFQSIAMVQAYLTQEDVLAFSWMAPLHKRIVCRRIQNGW